jgi:hypothetical protein
VYCGLFNLLALILSIIKKKNTMKNLILALFLLAGGYAFGQSDSTGAAIAEKVDGYYIYLLSKPAVEYEVLGVVSVGSTATNGYNERKDKMIRKVSKKYPDADGIIFDFSGGWSADKGTVISFK